MERNKIIKKMKTKLKRITIGIPAFNEQANIENLILDLLNQKNSKQIIETIIIVSDGSTDNTVKIVKKFKDSRILLIDSRDRRGKAFSQNVIYSMSKTDYLLVLDADTRIYQKDFIQLMVDYAVNRPEFKLVCAENISNTKHSLFEKVLGHAQLFKSDLFKKLFDLDKPLFVCNGRAMLYSKKVYKILKLPKEIIADDAYIGLFCLKNNFKIGYQNNAHIFFKQPSNMMDHYRQSKRFSDGKKQIEKYFVGKISIDSYSIPLDLFLSTFLKWFIVNPIYMTMYCVEMLCIACITFFSKNSYTSLWEISKTSK